MAMMIQRRPRTKRVGRPYIGPKVQVNIPEDQHDAIVREFNRANLREEDWADLLREVVAAGVETLLARPGTMGRAVARRSAR